MNHQVTSQRKAKVRWIIWHVLNLIGCRGLTTCPVLLTLLSFYISFIINKLIVIFKVAPYFGLIFFFWLVFSSISCLTDLKLCKEACQGFSLRLMGNVCEIMKDYKKLNLIMRTNYKQLCNSVVAGLSTLPDNPGVSRFWTLSPGLQIYVCNLQILSRIFWSPDLCL